MDTVAGYCSVSFAQVFGRLAHGVLNAQDLRQCHHLEPMPLLQPKVSNNEVANAAETIPQRPPRGDDADASLELRVRPQTFVNRDMYNNISRPTRGAVHIRVPTACRKTLLTCRAYNAMYLR